MSQKTVSRTRSTTISSATKAKVATPNPESQYGNEWMFKITGRGTSGWMSWVWEDPDRGLPDRGVGQWVKLRSSNTSFISAVAAIEPELMRLAFPHHTTKRKAI